MLNDRLEFAGCRPNKVSFCILLSPNDSTHPANASPTSLNIPNILPAGALLAICDLEATLLHLSASVVSSHNIPNTEELLSVEGENITEEEWTDEDIVEQTCINAIEGEGGIVEGLDDEASVVDIPLLSLTSACHALSEVLRLCDT